METNGSIRDRSFIRITTVKNFKTKFFRTVPENFRIKKGIRRKGLGKMKLFEKRQDH